MKKHSTHALFLAITLSSLGLAACNQPGSAQEAGRKIDETTEQVSQAVQKSLDKAQGSTKSEVKQIDTNVSDADITAKVKMALMMRDGLNSLTISVQTNSRVVTLNGSVATQAQSKLAQELASAVNDVTHVDNNLSVVSAAN
jgi:hyperosmotically inducible protein